MPSTAVTWPKRLTNPSTRKGGDADVEATGTNVTGEDDDAISRFAYTILRIRGGICEGFAKEVCAGVPPRSRQTPGTLRFLSSLIALVSERGGTAFEAEHRAGEQTISRQCLGATRST